MELKYNLLENISDEEYEMLDVYRKSYVSDEVINHSYVPIEQILTPWNKSKQDLYQLFGEKLIVSKEFEYVKEEDELYSDISNMIYDTKKTYGRQQRTAQTFRNNYYEWVEKHFPSSTINDCWETIKYEEMRVDDPRIRYNLQDLISPNTLAENEYNESKFSITLPNGKIHTVTPGTKAIKALSVIANAFNIEGFEDFRICHSLIHNQKKVKGTLTLSIHPLDYWTMSDNNCDWDSCMSWRNYGSYRQGTIEMMNSPWVIVAYIDSKNTSLDIGEGKWNSKKWRQLFIVNKDLILGIKSYPYSNEQITNFTMKWLKELAATNLGWSYMGYPATPDEPIEYQANGVLDIQVDGKWLELHFESEIMYTDVGCLVSHPLYLSSDLANGIMEKTEDGKYYTTPVIKFCYPYNNYMAQNVISMKYNYSGCSECMVCGTLFPHIEGENELACSECLYATFCEICNHGIPHDAIYRVDGVTMCEECYSYNAMSCLVCEEEHLKENLREIYVTIPVNDEIAKELAHKYFYYYFPNTLSPQQDEKYIFALNSPIYVCPEHLDKFLEEFTDNRMDQIEYDFYDYDCAIAIDAQHLKFDKIMPILYDINYEGFLMMRRLQDYKIAKTELSGIASYLNIDGSFWRDYIIQNKYDLMGLCRRDKKIA